MHLDAGYDYQPCRQVLAVRAWWVRSLLVACQPRFRLVAGG
jgi:hypothetical protein